MGREGTELYDVQEIKLLCPLWSKRLSGSDGEVHTYLHRWALCQTKPDWIGILGQDYPEVHSHRYRRIHR